MSDRVFTVCVLAMLAAFAGTTFAVIATVR
jgi:hypothetical protein